MKRLLLCAVVALTSSCATFGGATISNDVPACERLIPPVLLSPVEGVEIPKPDQWPDGHEKVEPFAIGYVGQTGQLDKANENAPAVDHIYRTCLELHREALRKANRGFFGRLFGS